MGHKVKFSAVPCLSRYKDASMKYDRAADILKYNSVSWTSGSRYCEGLYCFRNAGNYSPKHAVARHKRLACSVTPL